MEPQETFVEIGAQLQLVGVKDPALGIDPFGGTLVHVHRGIKPTADGGGAFVKGIGGRELRWDDKLAGAIDVAPVAVDRDGSEALTELWERFEVLEVIKLRSDDLLAGLIDESELLVFDDREKLRRVLRPGCNRRREDKSKPEEPARRNECSTLYGYRLRLPVSRERISAQKFTSAATSGQCIRRPLEPKCFSREVSWPLLLRGSHAIGRLVSAEGLGGIDERGAAGRSAASRPTVTRRISRTIEARD